MTPIRTGDDQANAMRGLPDLSRDPAARAVA
jgi:hypothetical protein